MSAPDAVDPATDVATDFASLALARPLVENLASLGYARMTPIQAAALPAILEGRDLIAQAKTGSGKTAAFGLGVLQSLDAKSFEVQALVLCPTRELAEQVGRELRSLARTTPNIKLLVLCGGTPIRAHREALTHGAHIVVGTPGRLRALIEKDRLKLAQLKLLVLDEADRMLEMGFEEDLRAILQKLPKARQTLLFSATYPEAIVQISADYQREPVRVTVDSELDETQLQELFFEVAPGVAAKSEALLQLIAHYQPQSTLIFCNTKDECQSVARALRRGGVHTLALNGDLEQRERDEVLTVFSNGSCSALVATDVAARGLDIEDLDCVVNYELSPEPNVHVHRVGRTGRAGKKGLALSLCTTNDSMRLDRIAASRSTPLKRMKLKAVASSNNAPPQPSMITLLIEGGRRDKLRPGDILGALTAGDQVAGDQVGKIQVLELRTYVAVKRSVEKRALDLLINGRIKKRKWKVSKVAAG